MRKKKQLLRIKILILDVRLRIDLQLGMYNCGCTYAREYNVMSPDFPCIYIYIVGEVIFNLQIIDGNSVVSHCKRAHI